MPAPLPTAVLYTSTSVYVIFDRAISATGGSELDGLVVTEDGSPLGMVFDAIDDNALIATLPAPTTGVVHVDYDGLGTLIEAAAPNDPVAAFSQDALPFPEVVNSLPLSVVAGVPTNDSLVLKFTEPLGSPSSDLLAGMSVEINGQALDLNAASASLNDDGTQLTIVTGVNPSYNAVVVVAYDEGVGDLRTWNTGTVDSFSRTALNLSTDGLPDSQYPLSFVLGQPLAIAGNAVTAELHLYLNPIDRGLSKAYSAVITTGGVFGESQANPSGVSVAGASVKLEDGAVISHTFSGIPVPDAVAAANDWQTTVTQRAGVELGRVRALDQSIVLGEQTVTGV